MNARPLTPAFPDRNLLIVPSVPTEVKPVVRPLSARLKVALAADVGMHAITAF